MHQGSDECTNDDDACSYSEDTDDETDKITRRLGIVDRVSASSIEGNKMVEFQINGITTKLRLNSGCQRSFFQKLYTSLSKTGQFN